jgi:cbb3-type cytochrome oxidase maturation protein
MTVIYIVLPLALLTVLVAVLSFSWATRSGQFDDLDTPGLRVLHDDTPLERRPPDP